MTKSHPLGIIPSVHENECQKSNWNAQIMWTIAKIITYLGILAKFCRFMRMSGECKSFKWINENECQNGMVKLILTNNVNYCKNNIIFRNPR